MAKVDQETSKTAMFLVMNVLSSVTIIMVRLSPAPGPRAPPRAPPPAPRSMRKHLRVRRAPLALTRPSVPP